MEVLSLPISNPNPNPISLEENRPKTSALCIYLMYVIYKVVSFNWLFVYGCSHFLSKGACFFSSLERYIVLDFETAQYLSIRATVDPDLSSRFIHLRLAWLTYWRIRSDHTIYD